MNNTLASAAADWAAALHEISQYAASAGDLARADRFAELEQKSQQKRFTVAFCGHFSAGKSTMINRLCGAELLPSSPIPTSANVVSIRNGPAGVRIIRRTEAGEQLIEVPLEQLQSYCTDGSAIASVEITYPLSHLNEQTVLLDTPGIDSTDDAHRMATESALHLADVVFYVMDYNHVQSEINFAFAKELKDWGKPLYLIVNQIDKHREQELSFEQYRSSVEEAFANWHLQPSGILYLSMRQPLHPYQEWDSLLALLQDLSGSAEQLNAYSIHSSSIQLLEEHLKWLQQQSESQRERFINDAGGEERLLAAETELRQLQEREQASQTAADTLRSRLRQEVQSLLDNANVTPAATRDLAHLFLESRKPGFKAGLLFAGAKTAAEQEKRLFAFLEDFRAQALAAIEWHLNELLRQEAYVLELPEEEIEQQLAELLTGVVDSELLLGQIPAGAMFSNEATMNYCRTLSAELKARYRRRALELVEQLALRAAAAGDAAAAAASARRAELAAPAQALAQLAALAAAEAAQQQRLAALLPAAPQRPALPAPTAARPAAAAAAALAAQQAQAPQRQPRGRDGAAAGGAAAVAAAAAAAAQQASGAAMLAPQRRAATMLQRAAELLAPQAPLAQAALAMRGKAERLQQSRFTIALFGAFSAGKSSFANALLGEAALPVSPNPTTAAINRIVPPTPEHRHGSARIAMKSREAMLDDIRYSLALLGEQTDQLEQEGLLRLIGALKPDALHPGGRPHYSFLKAVLKGWEELNAHLGQQLYVDQEAYRRFVAEEARSCFVSEIDLYYDCPLTSQGIVLVDTPGADSVNARHTGVAFNYIKNADAILFVTYYNHAFSQADRQFLMQLGRVKDQFELDKMFFIVNAADLARDEEELAGVLAHVQQNLLQFGIRKPRLFPVSSLDALQAKAQGDDSQLSASGLGAFEASFTSFVSEELGMLAVASAEQDIDRSVREVSSWIEAAESDADTRMRRRSELEASSRQLQQQLQQQALGGSFEPLAQELRELVYYVLQRLQFRFGDHYNYAFNPSALQSDGRDLKRMLWTSWLELQRLLQNELSEELLATSLRMENAIQKHVTRAYEDTAEQCCELLPALTFAPLEPQPLATPELGEPWRTDAIEPKVLWASFKSPKHFFEGEGKAQLRKYLEQQIAQPMQSYTETIAERWQQEYAKGWQDQLQLAKQQLLSEIESNTAGMLASLSQSVDPAELRGLREVLIELRRQQ